MVYKTKEKVKVLATAHVVGKGSGAVSAEAAEGGAQTLYRGVNSTSPAYENATQGTATALEHNTISTESNFTSWTTNPEVAKNFALRGSGEGVVLDANIPNSQTVKSPNVFEVQLIQSGKIVSESEVLVKGTVKNANTTNVNQ